jgi:ankyrin repeat protein
MRDSVGATALHHAAFGGHRAVVEELARVGADINARDDRFEATPTGWAIEYLRELGGLLGTELNDFAHAIQTGQVEWVRRFLQRFPILRQARDAQGTPFKALARQSGNQEITKMFE